MRKLCLKYLQWSYRNTELPKPKEQEGKFDYFVRCSNHFLYVIKHPDFTDRTAEILIQYKQYGAH